MFMRKVPAVKRKNESITHLRFSQVSCYRVKSAMGLNLHLKWRQAQQDQMASDDLTQFIKVGTYRSYRMHTASACMDAQNKSLHMLRKL